MIFVAIKNVYPSSFGAVFGSGIWDPVSWIRNTVIPRIIFKFKESITSNQIKL
jgi:hypothetical protein